MNGQSDGRSSIATDFGEEETLRRTVHETPLDELIGDLSPAPLQLMEDQSSIRLESTRRNNPLFTSGDGSNGGGRGGNSGHGGGGRSADVQNDSRRVSNPDSWEDDSGGHDYLPNNGIQPYGSTIATSPSSTSLASAPPRAQSRASTWKNRGMSLKAKSMMTMSRLGTKLDKKVSLDNKYGESLVKRCCLHGILPWLLLLLVLGGTTGIVVYYMKTSGIMVDISLKSFLVQEHPLVRAEQGVLGAIPWCIRQTSCYWNKCPVKSDVTGAQTMFMPYDENLLNRRHRRGGGHRDHGDDANSTADSTLGTNADADADARFKFEAAMQEASANWTDPYVPTPEDHPNHQNFYDERACTTPYQSQTLVACAVCSRMMTHRAFTLDVICRN